MLKVIPAILIFILTGVNCFSQLSDIISVQKKNGRNIRTFGAGSPFNFYTSQGNYVEGYISEIRDDSVFIISYDIRAFPNFWGVTTVDTFASYRSGFNYREIASIQVSDRQKFTSVSIDKLLMIGGAGYFLLNTVNSDYLKQPFSDAKNITTLGISAGVFGLGLFINKFGKDNRFSKRRHKIVYIRLR